MSFRKNPNWHRPEKMSLRAYGQAGRIWLSRLLRIGTRASMTVEAALVLPLFLFCMAEVLYVFTMIRAESCMLAALHESGTEVSEYCFYYRYGLSDILSLKEGGSSTVAETESDSALGEILASAALSQTWVRSNVSSYFEENSLDDSCIEGGTGGVSYLQSSLLVDDDDVDLVADYHLKPFLPLFGLGSISAQSRYYSHAWVGYDVEKASGDDGSGGPYVYVTETGTVYHVSRSCTYLNPSIHTVSAAELDSLRNEEGARYYACELCHPSKNGTVIITREGNRYHSSATCSGLKRTIRKVPLSEVEGKMRACSKCGGN